MKKTDFYFDSRDGLTKIHAVRYEPKDEALTDGKPVAILQIAHGMAEYIERYEETAKYFTERGFVVTGADHLGHGGSVGMDGCFGYFCEQDPATVVVRDVHRLKKMTQELYPGVPYFILGHSLGSYMVRNYICRYGTGIQGALLLGTGQNSSVQLAGVKALAVEQKCFGGDKRKSQVLHNLVFGGVNKRIENPKSEFDWLTFNEENVAKYNADERCGFMFTVNGFATLFELVARCLKKENLEKIPKELPIILLSGAEDPIGNYGAGVDAVMDSYDEVGMLDVSSILYEGARHEILNEEVGVQVMEDIYEWILDHLPEALA